MVSVGTVGYSVGDLDFDAEPDDTILSESGAACVASSLEYLLNAGFTEDLDTAARILINLLISSGYEGQVIFTGSKYEVALFKYVREEIY